MIVFRDMMAANKRTAALRRGRVLRFFIDGRTSLKGDELLGKMVSFFMLDGFHGGEVEFNTQTSTCLLEPVKPIIHFCMKQ
ncbi:hypothetical protein [Geobacillus thermodenitrificans]|uniref:Uncharacterized protein n=3 Tax=Geobacillus TaxID=129337 RepID=A4ILH1_GEOTN|nr:hypothetical protein [Geobacillus thermodenitrificans]ABO66175.1 hypothetical protein GTNG_0797 [Geobacillus thermodenitrificans NG80-2]WMV77110.1 hypothetical protein HSX42_04845 [Geobacillus thermodenitrificans]